jgi:adenosylhomocysteine nucleosidase
MENSKSHAKHIAIVIPTSFELAPFLKIWPDLEQVSDQPWEVYKFTTGAVIAHLIVSYIGPANAAAATERIIALNHGFGGGIEAVLHGGAAGAIDASLMPGDIVLGRECKTICSREILAVRKSLLLSASAIRYLDHGKPVHVDSLAGDPILLAKAAQAAVSVTAEYPSWTGAGWPSDIEARAPRVVEGCVGSQDGWTKSPDELDFIGTTFGVQTEDMESTYVAQIAAKHRIPFLAVRVISNNERVGTLAKNEILPAIGLAAERVARVLCALVAELSK